MKITIELDTLDELADFVAIIRGERAVNPTELARVTAELQQSTTDLKAAVDDANANQPGD